MPSNKVDLAVIGSTSLIGEAFITLLGERAFPFAELFPLESDEAAGGRVECGGKHWRVASAEAFDFGMAQLVVICDGESEQVQEWAQRALGAGALVVDLTATHRYATGVPLVLPELNPHALVDLRESGLVAVPDALSCALALVLAPLQGLAPLNRLSITALYSISHAGRQGVDRLARQTVALLNCRELELDGLPSQVAFNLHPQVGGLDAEGWSSAELGLAEELQRLFDYNLPQAQVSAVQVPTFYGDSATLTLEFAQPVALALLREALAEAPGLALMDANHGAGYPTPVGEAIGQDEVLVGRLRQHPISEENVTLWVTIDNLRKGSALNGIQIAEILVKDYI